jgi:hypothetical protein
MGPVAYFSPAYIGFVLGLVIATSFRPLQPGQPAWAHWGLMVLSATGVAAAAQLAFVGAQGAFAQVLPAHRGRSVRGRPAILAGTLLLFFVAALAAAIVMYRDTWDASTWAGFGVAGIFLAGALATYGWALPAAVQDFTAED